MTSRVEWVKHGHIWVLDVGHDIRSVVSKLPNGDWQYVLIVNDEEVRRGWPTRTIAPSKKKGRAAAIHEARKIGDWIVNPDDRELLSKLRFEYDDNPRFAYGRKKKYVAISAYLGDELVGGANFVIGSKLLHARKDREGVWVDPKYRRKGVASELYRRAEIHWNRTVRHAGRSHQTPDGRAFAAGRRNPIYRRNFRVNARNLVSPSDTIPIPGTSYKIYIYEVPAPLGGMMMRAIVKDGKTAIGDVRLVDDMDAWVPESAGFKEEYRGKGLYMKTLQELADWMGDEIKPSTVRSESAHRAWEKFGKKRVRPRA